MQLPFFLTSGAALTELPANAAITSEFKYSYPYSSFRMFMFHGIEMVPQNIGFNFRPLMQNVFNMIPFIGVL